MRLVEQLVHLICEGDDNPKDAAYWDKQASRPSWQASPECRVGMRDGELRDE